LEEVAVTFGAPQWFEGFLLLPLLAGLFLRNEMLREHLLVKLVAARLLPDLAASTSAARRRWKFALALAGLACVIAALTQPRVGYEVIENHRRGLDLMLAVDTSKSMLSTDVQPDRLSRARFAAQDLIDSLTGDRAGLIAFAGTAFVEAPLTIDYAAVENSLNALDTDTIPRGGTNIASAIREAAEAFGKGESTHRALVLFTDGEELEDDAVQAAKEVNGQFRIFTVGVGTPEGSLIPLPDANGGTDFLKDDQGEYVKSHLDEAKLKEIADATGGFYVHLDNGPATAKAIIEQGLGKMQEHEFETRETIPIERYEWPLAAGILLLLAAMLIRERRRVEQTPREPVRARRVAEAAPVAVAAVALLMLLPVRGWSMNQGLDLYDQKNYKGATDLFERQLQGNPDSAGLEFDRGASAYKEGDYDKALESFGKALGSTDQGLRGQAEYNLGNTLVQRGALQDGKDEKIKEWTDALKHYDEALKVDPNNADAKYNEEVVRKMIDDLNQKQQKQQQQQQQDQKNQQNQQNQQNQKNQQNQQNQQNQNKQNQSQQSQAQNQQGQGQQQQNQQNQNQQNQQNQPNQAQNQQGGQQQDQQKQQNQQGQSQQQNQQAQNQQKQNQQGQGQQNQQAQNQQGQGQQQNQQQASGSTQPDQQQSAQQKQGEQNQASANPTQNMNGPSPSPTPGNGPGVLKEQSQQDQQADARAAARAATEQAHPGEMTPSQAQALIDSLRGEEEHVSFEDRKHQDNETYKDW
jgi:Ca-activated chloride channel family protein